MNVLAINGASNKDGNTGDLIEKALEPIEAKEIDTKYHHIDSSDIQGCTACGKCFENKNKECIYKDQINDLIKKLDRSQAVLLGSPTYFSDLTPQMKAFVDRAGNVGLANDYLWEKKIGAPIAAVRRAGAINVIDSINHFFLINKMIIPGSSYWNLGQGEEHGEVMEDEEGLETMKELGKQIVWLLDKTNN